MSTKFPATYRKSLSYVYDAATDSWVPEVQPATTSGGGGGGAGDASAANQTTGNASLSSIDSKLSSQATASNQSTGNASAASIDTKLNSQATSANQSILVTTVGGVTETAPASDTASSGINGRLQRIAQRISSLIALLPTALSNGFFQVSLKETVTVPVSGTFFQATQPVSGTVATTPPANASTNVAQMAGVAPSLNTGVRDAGTQRVTIATNDVVPVTGTFWQTTQPVSGTFWQATQPVSGTFWQATQPVSGAFFQATQPVSIASMPSTPVTGAFFQATQPVSNAGIFATQPTETRPSTAALTQADWTAISDSTRALTLIAANAARRGLSVRNDTDMKILIREGGTASPTAYTDILYPGDEYVADYPVCTGLLSAYVPTIPQGLMLITERT